MASKCTKGAGVEVYSGKNWIVIFKLFCALLIIFAWKRRVKIFNHYYLLLGQDGPPVAFFLDDLTGKWGIVTSVLKLNDKSLNRQGLL